MIPFTCRGSRENRTHPIPTWRLERTLRHLSHHHSSRFHSFHCFTLPRPCSLSCPVQATPQSSAASCPGAEVAEVRLFDERLWKKLCVEACTPDVNDCHNVILVPSSGRNVTEYTLHPFQSRSWSVNGHSRCRPSICTLVHRARTFSFSGVPLFVDDQSGPDHFASTCLLSIDHLEFAHLFDVFLPFSVGLIDQSYRNASFLGVVSHQLLTFLVKAVFHHPVDVQAVHLSNFLHDLCKRRRTLSKFEMTDIDGPDRPSRMIVSLHPVLFWMFFAIGSYAMLPTNSHTNPRPCVDCARHKSHVDSS